MRLISSILVLLSLISGPIWANDFIPDRRTALVKGQDFYGSDLQSIFDTTLSACQNACLADKRCQAFTFNDRSKACFPKSKVSDIKPYDGAYSAYVFKTEPNILIGAAMRAAELTFLHPSDLSEAKLLAQRVGILYDTRDRGVAELWQLGRESMSNNRYRDAQYYFGAALALDDMADLWSQYSRASYNDRSGDYSHKNKQKRRALSAAVNAYLRSVSDGEKAQALLVMADALELNGRNKKMVRALRLAERISPTREVLSKLDYAVQKYGLKVSEHDVESDLAEPRICAKFSEPLAAKTVDYAPYVALPQGDLSIEANDNSLCISGVEHGKRYDFTLREGLPAKSGETLLKDVALSIYVNDRAPSAKFPGRSYVLPKSTEAGIPIDTVNATELELVLRRVSDRNLLRAIQDDYFGHPISRWQLEKFSSQVAQELWRGTAKVQNQLNKNVTTRLPMGEVIRDLPAGIYALQAGIPGADPYDNPPATQWFVLSDLGLASMSGTDGVHVFVRGLGDAVPKAGIEVALLSKSNTVLAEQKTDERGYVRFADALARGTGGAKPALIVAKQGDQDIAFLSLSDPAFDLSDRGVEGREPAKHIDMFLTTDRGAYRAGETINVTALVRNATADAIVGLPVTAVLTRPDGVEYSRHVSNAQTERLGGHVFNLPTGPNVPRGTWKLALFTDPEAPALADTSFLIEDFLPERIDFDLTLPKTPLQVANGTVLTADARYLFGAPGADLAFEGEVLLRPVNGLKAYPGYSFGRYDERFDPVLKTLNSGLQTDAKGVVRVPVEFPDVGNPNQPLEAKFTARISEGSGRPVERQIVKPLAPAKAMIGIKPLFEDVVSEGSAARFQVIAIDQNLAQTPMQVKWSVNRIQTRYQWYQQYGNWDWEAIQTRKRVASGSADLNGAPIEIEADVDWGEYELVVEGIGGEYVASSSSFYAGWYAPADASSTPDTLEVSLDKPAYTTGETATLRLVPRYAGKALITVVSNRLIDMKVVDVSKGENLVPLSVTDQWGAGAYVTATVIKPMDAAKGHNPARALGLSYAPVDPGARKLAARFEMPAQAEPRAPLDVVLKVDGIAPGETAYATIAAVDLGILNLTGFETPDAPGHYFGQRKLGVGMRDVYGRLIDGMNGAVGTIRSGGDAGSEARLQSPPPTEELVAYFTGPVQIGEDGIARARFDLPEFNGTVRLMAVVWSSAGVGKADSDILVRDPVVLNASLPRFLAPGDSSRMLLEITHASGPSGNIGLAVTGQGIAVDNSAVPAQISLGDLQKASLSVPIKAGEIGAHQINVQLTTPDGKVLTKQLALQVEANDPEVSRTFRFELAAGQSFLFDDNVFTGLQTGTGSALLSVGPMARFDAPGLLAALDRYPYGCTEQTTSRALPLLYLNEVAKVMGLESHGKITERIDQAIERVLSNQSSNGAFGLWGPSEGDFWLDAYVTDFLSQARAKGYNVPDRAFRAAMDNLRNRVNYAPEFDDGGQDVAYALFVLAREGVANIGDLRYYSDTKADNFATPMALAHLGAALASYGDQPRADRMFARAARTVETRLGQDEANFWRSDYGSDLRDGAAVLALAVDAGSTAFDTNALAHQVSNAYAQDEYHSTQESVWSLMAVKALVSDPNMQGFTINGAPVQGPLVRVLQDGASQSGFDIRNGTSQDETVTMTTFGVPDQPEPAGGYGYAITRSYYTMDGQPVDPSGHAVGSRLVVVLTVKPFGDTEGRLMVNDPLPAGFEIDNPSLMTGGSTKALSWLDTTSDVSHSEFRSNRFLSAVDLRNSKPFRLAYIVRAISPGRYHHPAASVEDMYRPEYRAHTDTGLITIKP
ncbi:MAG: PAN domain-containing protein [Rhodobacterales bacterium]|nr:MAG: PAN domain-containing protein [Rhodobacterales bacterium]